MGVAFSLASCKNEESAREVEKKPSMTEGEVEDEENIDLKEARLPSVVAGI